jgi:hypothetical protein
LNEHLAQLEAVGLLRRVPRLDPLTKRQLPTRYILGFEPNFTPADGTPCPAIGHGDKPPTETEETTGTSGPIDLSALSPCPNSGHGKDAEAVSGNRPDPCPENAGTRVRNPDTNPVREPLSKPVKEEGAQARREITDEFFEALLVALGLEKEALPGWWQGWPPRLHVQRWRDEMGLSEVEIIAVARASREDHPKPPNGPKALDRVMQLAAQRLKQPGCASRAQVSAAKRETNASGGETRGRKRDETPRPSPDEQMAFYADLVNSDRYLPPSAISNTLRDAMLDRGLVTAERLRARGVR